MKPIHLIVFVAPTIVLVAVVCLVLILKHRSEPETTITTASTVYEFNGEKFMKITGAPILEIPVDFSHSHSVYNVPGVSPPGDSLLKKISESNKKDPSKDNGSRK